MKKVLNALIVFVLVCGNFTLGSAENESYFINSGSSEETVALYTEAHGNGTVLGWLYSGAEVEDFADAADGWAHIWIRDMEGYIRSEFLEVTLSGTPRFRPPMQAMREGEMVIFSDSANGEEVEVLTCYDPAWILGRVSDRYLVRTETWISESETGYIFGYVPCSAFEAGTLKSASTLAFALRDAPLFQWAAPDQPEATGEILPKGAAFTIVTGCVESLVERGRWYLTPDDQFLCVMTYDPDGTPYLNWVRMEDVSFDEGLMIPEIMTRG